MKVPGGIRTYTKPPASVRSAGGCPDLFPGRAGGGACAQRQLVALLSSKQKKSAARFQLQAIVAAFIPQNVLFVISRLG
jgi:hypothetical protein